MERREEYLGIIERAKDMVTPRDQEVKKLDRVSKNVAALLEHSFKEAKGATVPEIVLGGSYPKGTWLRGSGDIDFYLLYPLSYTRQELEGEAIDISRRAVKGYEIQMRFAEHPYVECFVDGIRVNIVPCYKVSKGEWQSAADRSPFHTEYIRSHFDDTLRSETRLLKKYVKALELYGAEVKTQGLSGYVCEVLTLKYGSFLSVLENISDLKEHEIISLEEYDRDVAKSFSSKLVILDPVDTTRNLGMAISASNVSRLILESRHFLSKPSLRCFEEGAKTRERKSAARNKKALLERTLIITFKTRPRSVDILWGQLGKSLAAVVQLLEFLGFEVLRSKASSNETDESALIVFLKEVDISQFRMRSGPDVFRRQDIDRFVGKNRSRAVLSWVDTGGKINFLIEREKKLRIATTALRKTLSDEKTVHSIGLAKEIGREITKGFSIHDGLFVLRAENYDKQWLVRDVQSIFRDEITD